MSKGEVLLKSKIDLQGLHISGQARNTHETKVVDFEHTLEVVVNGHQVGCETRVSSNCNAVLACHCHQRVTVVAVHLQNIG